MDWHQMRAPRLGKARIVHATATDPQRKRSIVVVLVALVATLAQGAFAGMIKSDVPNDHAFSTKCRESSFVIFLG